jgi:hypothetical protein
MPESSCLATKQCVDCGREVVAHSANQHPLCKFCIQKRVLNELEDNARENHD